MVLDKEMTPYCENKWAKIYKGDCLEIMPLLPEVDMILFDPPFEQPGQTLEWINVGRRILKSGGIASHFTPVWDLKNTLNRMTKWFSICEIVCLERTGKSWTPLIITANEQRPLEKYRAYRTGGGPKPIGERIHDAQRPDGLMRWLIRNYTRPTDVVLDPFMGSGVLGLACRALGREYIGIELSERWCFKASQLLGIKNIPSVNTNVMDGCGLLKIFRDKYASKLPSPVTILDIGSRYFGREKISPYRNVFSDARYNYTGMDMTPGNNVDIVGYESITKPYDCVISTYVLEHVKKPWDWLKNLVPFFKNYICIIAPFGYKKHSYPVDTYRYFPDGLEDLFEYAGIKKLEVVVGHREIMGIGEK